MSRFTTKTSSKGGRARIRLHGNPGTPEGRRLGGIRSQANHSKRETSFKVLQKAKLPRKSKELAELLGILAGDGHVGLYQVSITTNAQTDYEHAEHARRLLLNTFGLPVTIRTRPDTNALVVLLSSKHACDLLRQFGLKARNKIRDQISPPVWITKRSSFVAAFLRGLIDTDGSVYFDKHCVNGKKYASVCIGFSNAPLPLLDFVENAWQAAGYRPTRFGRNVRLRRKDDVLRYVATIGFNNPKHLRKIKV